MDPTTNNKIIFSKNISIHFLS